MNKLDDFWNRFSNQNENSLERLNDIINNEIILDYWRLEKNDISNIERQKLIKLFNFITSTLQCIQNIFPDKVFKGNLLAYFVVVYGGVNKSSDQISFNDFDVIIKDRKATDSNGVINLYDFINSLINFLNELKENNKRSALIDPITDNIYQLLVYLIMIAKNNNVSLEEIAEETISKYVTQEKRAKKYRNSLQTSPVRVIPRRVREKKPEIPLTGKKAANKNDGPDGH